MNKTIYYVNGNAVRKLEEAEPQRHGHSTRRELEDARRRKNRRRAARRNQERALSMNRAFVTFLTACVLASAFVSVIWTVPLPASSAIPYSPTST